MVCSRSGVRLYAATPRSGPGLLCAAVRFVSAKKATMAACGCRAYFFNFFRMLWYGYFFFGDAELFSPSMIGFFSKDFFSLLEGLEFTPAASATTKGDIYVPGTCTTFLFSV